MKRKIVAMDERLVGMKFYLNLDHGQYAFVFTKGTADAMVMIFNMMSKKNHVLYHVMKEPICKKQENKYFIFYFNIWFCLSVCSVTSFRVSVNFTLTKRFNDILQTAVETGLYQIYDRWMTTYFKSIFSLDIVTEDVHKPLTMIQINEIFFMYFIGMFGGVLSFVVEHLLVKCGNY